MKKIGMQASTLICFLILTVVASGAQTVGLNVDIPFTFNVTEKVLPPGHYLILAPQGQTLRILGPAGAAVLTLVNQVSVKRPDGPGAVTFNCYGKRCFLSRFWTARSETGVELLRGQLEKEMATEKDQLAVITLKAVPVDR